MPGLSNQEIARVINRYIGVRSGYLGDFSYRSHEDFYPLHCDLDIDPNQYPGKTTRERFVEVLKSQKPENQAKILRGVIDRFPVEAENAPPTRTQALKEEIEAIIRRLEQNAPVANPAPQITSAVVDQAITDAENLLRTSGPASAVDRVHTAMHGYLRAVCDQAGIGYAEDDGSTRLLRLLRQQHPALRIVGPGSEAEKILNSFGATLEALNTWRNHASLAHPNVALLDEEEANLAINATRTILHYLDAKFQ